jgi:hypothetical protein
MYVALWGDLERATESGQSVTFRRGTHFSGQEYPFGMLCRRVGYKRGFRSEVFINCEAGTVEVRWSRRAEVLPPAWLILATPADGSPVYWLVKVFEDQETAETWIEMENRKLREEFRDRRKLMAVETIPRVK